MIDNLHKDIQPNLRKYNQELIDMKPQEMLKWGYEKFDNQFAITTSFGIQSSVCLLYTSPSPRDVEESRMPSSA